MLERHKVLQFQTLMDLKVIKSVCKIDGENVVFWQTDKGFVKTATKVTQFILMFLEQH